MTYTTTIPRELSRRRIDQPIPLRLSRKTCQAQFLIVCHGSGSYGDAAVGPLVATAVSDWQLDSVNAVAIAQFTPDLTLELAKADYVIFVEPCANSQRAIQLCPIVARQPQSEANYGEANSCSPHALLRLTQQLHNASPQSWLLKVPTKDFRFAEELSSTAKTGISQALKIITQFLRTYQLPLRQLQNLS